MTYSLFGSTFSEEVYSVSPAVAVIVDVPWNSLPAESTELLSKILVAIKSTTEGVRIIYQPNLDMSSWAELPTRVIGFVQPPVGIALYERIVTPTTEMVISEPLSVLVASEPAKRKLWAALKTLSPS